MSQRIISSDTLMGHIKISRIDLTQFYPLNGTSVRLCLSMDILAECSFMHDRTDNIQILATSLGSIISLVKYHMYH